MNDTHAVDYVADFRARWPEWALALPFVPAPQRAVVEHWFALLQVLTDAAWGGSDPTPGLAKLAWWQEELAGWSRGARRHPLGDVLQKQVAPWKDLGLALRVLPATRGRPGETGSDEAISVFAQAASECERALFGEAGAVAGEGGRPVDGVAVSESLRREHLVAHAGTAPAATDTRVITSDTGATRPRRIHLALQRARRRVDLPSPPLRVVWVAWRAARGS